MGCSRPKVYDDAEHLIGVDDPVEIWFVPSEANEGQMDFRNVGATTIAIRLGRAKGEIGKDAVRLTGPYTILLAGSATGLTGDSFTEEGIVPGAIVAISSAAGGKLSTKVTYR